MRKTKISRVGKIVFSLLLIAMIILLYQVFLLASDKRNNRDAIIADAGRMMNRVKPKKLTIFDDVDSIRLLKTLKGHKGSVNSVAISSDSRYIVSGGVDKTVRIWDTNNGRLLKILKGHKKGVWSIAFTPRGDILASGSLDKTIKLWSVRTWKVFRTLKGHRHCVISLAFSPDGRLLASGSLDKSIRIWLPYTGKLVKKLDRYLMPIWKIAFSPDGTLLASVFAKEKDITIWSTRTWKKLILLSGHQNTVVSIAF